MMRFEPPVMISRAGAESRQAPPFHPREFSLRLNECPHSQDHKQSANNGNVIAAPHSSEPAYLSSYVDI